MFLLLAALLQNFTVKPAPGEALPTTGPDLPGLVLTKKNMWVRFEPRSEHAPSLTETKGAIHSQHEKSRRLHP
jgi:hypothetical protein